MNDMTTKGPGGLLGVEAQKAIAEIQGQIMIAKSCPRDEDQALAGILKACHRPALAEKATYVYARGGTEINGPSIRLMETIAQQWGNITFGFRELSRGTDRDGVTFSEVECSAWDMQANTKRTVQFRVRHWRDTKKGGYMLSDERDIYELVANQAARRTRACILAVIPGDVVDAALSVCSETLETQEESSIKDRVARMLQAFAKFGVTEEMISARVQRNIDAITGQQLAGLQRIYNSLKDGMGKVDDFFTTQDSAKDAEAPKRGADALKAKLEGKS